jgi:hypothetical protein
VTGPNKNSIGSLGVETRITSFSLSLKGFILKSSPTSNKERSDTLNEALMYIFLVIPLFRHYL